jgi:hypothetical protein
MKKSTVRRLGRPAIVAIVALAALTAGTANVRAKNSAVATAPRDAGEPIMAVVSIKSQQITFYDADGWFLKAPVSTGIRGRETPAGVFAVIEKDKNHRSTLYDDAWMPHMQRLTWNGIAFHGGPLPGYAASHGCVRMPYRIAKGLFDKTRLGMRVIISPDDATPIAFSHPALLEPDAAAVAAAPERAETLAREAAEAAKTAIATKKAARKAARAAKSAKRTLRKLKRRKSYADDRLADAEKALEKAKSREAKAQEQKLKAAAKAAEAGTKLDAAKADADASINAATKAAEAAKAAGETKKAARKAARAAASAKKTLRKLRRRKSYADDELADAEKALEKAKSRVAKAQARRLKAATKAAEAATKLDIAKAKTTWKKHAAAKAADAAKEAATRKVDTAKAAKEAKLALEPVSVYISRATKKLYVRRNTHKPWPDGGEVFDASIEVSVTIRDPDKPIGTHVFTAMAPTDTGLRWAAVTIDNGDDAKDALDRISIPKEVLDRIAPTALPRSSIVVSDEPLSRETNYRTEFVAVLSNHPQGGFKTRRPTPKVSADAEDDKSWQPGLFGFFGQPSQDRRRGDRRRRRRRHHGKPGLLW